MESERTNRSASLGLEGLHRGQGMADINQTKSQLEVSVPSVPGETHMGLITAYSFCLRNTVAVSTGLVLNGPNHPQEVVAGSIDDESGQGLPICSQHLT